jgi:hypothetical protein
MDRAHLLEDLVLHSLDSRTAAAEVRGQVDSSHFDAYASLIALVADHDLHVPEAPPRGAPRRESIRGHLEALRQRATRRGTPAPEFAGHDRRAELATTALATFALLADRSPAGEVPVLVAHLLGRPVPPHVPRQPSRDPRGPDAH